jgi:hypothetical protein
MTHAPTVANKFVENLFPASVASPVLLLVLSLRDVKAEGTKDVYKCT